MFTLIDRYITRMFWVYFLGALLVFVTIFLVIDSMSVFMKQEVPTGAMIRYYAFYAPAIMYQMMPVACLMATIFTLSTLHRSNELVALFSVGMSLLRVSLPILLWVVFIVLVSFGLADQVLPTLAQKKNFVLYVEIKNQPNLYSTVKTNKIWYRSDNILFNIKTLNPEKARAEGITLYYFDGQWRLIQLVTAAKALIKDKSWILKDGKVTLFAQESSFPLTESFTEKTVDLGQDMTDLPSMAASAEHLSLRELNRFIDRNKEAGLDTLQYEVDFHSKMGFPFAALVMSLLGVPFSVSRQRSGGAFFGIGLCLVMVFLYWTLYSSAITLGKHGAVSPIVAGWAPNFIFLCIAAYFFKRVPY